MGKVRLRSIIHICNPELAVSGDLSFEDKQAALEKAQEQGLDVVKIANILASRVGDIIDVCSSDCSNPNDALIIPSDSTPSKRS
jgi:hypothetical protein